MDEIQIFDFIVQKRRDHAGKICGTSREKNESGECTPTAACRFVARRATKFGFFFRLQVHPANRDLQPSLSVSIGARSLSERVRPVEMDVSGRHNHKRTLTSIIISSFLI
jgi:hypothetical protein